MKSLSCGITAERSTLNVQRSMSKFRYAQRRTSPSRIAVMSSWRTVSQFPTSLGDRAIGCECKNCLRMSEPNERESNSRHQKGQLAPDKIGTEILANERTFLAWVRTSIAVMSLGFVIARFSLWMREFATRVNPQMPMRGSGLSAPLGECMIGAGALNHGVRRLALPCDSPHDSPRRNPSRPANGHRYHCDCAAGCGSSDRLHAGFGRIGLRSKTLSYGSTDLIAQSGVFYFPRESKPSWHRMPGCGRRFGYSR